ncbi:DEAD/DEAH box helicase [Flavivirga aquatica]|uniref:DEAD/DEAH box helicase n=1 Tax=Flavivirga aquatica TaxID=1849968 RepID=A0A1E5T7I9_9FLAO|nr:DEAD/DEAH box helicase [Flavivirga aquatica]OEK07343.1 DEAD/DEAH box helicase [Flavivirga aquatica]
MAYQLLSEPIRKYIRDKRWESLRPIQAAAITKIMQTDLNYILASRTASGKTEAAFLPILSKTNFSESGVQVLYISPLIALINDQFLRVEDLCKNLEIPVTKWHGEASRGDKNKLIKNPEGIVLITPESLEAMFANKPYNAKKLFGNLKYIVIDEIHSFIGVDRGIHLMSILHRLQEQNKKKIIVLGLSATIGSENYIEAKKITGAPEHTKILVDKAKKDTIARFTYFENKTAELSLDLLKKLYIHTKDYKVLIFPNSRGKTEEIAVKLRKISDRIGGHPYYYSHHSSVDKEIREHVEAFAKNNRRFNFCIACTSTLELGIDIDTVDKIVQIDATFSVASLVQRIGRSGRRERGQSIVDMYTTDPWSLLQSLACWNLYKKGFLEPVRIAEKPYDLLFHQMLSIAKQLLGCPIITFIERLHCNPAFKHIERTNIEKLVSESITFEYLEEVQREIILGVEGEKIVNTRDFYGVFKTEPNLKVIHGSNKIGEIPFSPQILVGENILLAAKIWKINDVDLKAATLKVNPAKDGRAPKFYGGGGNIHSRIREEMLEILVSNESYEELDESCNIELHTLRNEFSGFILKEKYDRPYIIKKDKLIIYTFSGSKINKSLQFLCALTGISTEYYDSDSTLELGILITQFEALKTTIITKYQSIDTELKKAITLNEALLEFSKFGSYLPINFQVEILKERYFDFEGALLFLDRVRLMESKSTTKNNF